MTFVGEPLPGDPPSARPQPDWRAPYLSIHTYFPYQPVYGFLGDGLRASVWHETVRSDGVRKCKPLACENFA
jgi:hypothetical protein